MAGRLLRRQRQPRSPRPPAPHRQRLGVARAGTRAIASCATRGHGAGSIGPVLSGRVGERLDRLTRVSGVSEGRQRPPRAGPLKHIFQIQSWTHARAKLSIIDHVADAEEMHNYISL